MGILEVLTIVFVVLKVTEYGEFADWSWVWVFSPLWIGYGAALVIWLFIVIVGGIIALFGGRH